MKKNCIICNAEMEGRADKLYCSRPCQEKGRKNLRNNGGQEHVCYFCDKEFTPIKYGHNRLYCYDCIPLGGNQRARIIELFKKKQGGKCSICGYDKYLGALDFHHEEPNSKEFTISNMDFRMDVIEAEVEKCVLLCSNCHREFHGGLINLEVGVNL